MFSNQNAYPDDDNINLADEGDGGSNLKDSQSSEAEEHFVELDERKAQLLHKIERVKDKIKAANKSQQFDVDDFLKVNSKLSSNAENPQMIRIRQAFEKKNKKSAQRIQSLQKKLENYQQVLKSLETGGPTPPIRRLKHDNVLSSVGQGLKDVGANIKESLTGYTGTVISVPKDLANKLLKRSGSADNIPTLSQKDSLEIMQNPDKMKASTVGTYHSKTARAPAGRSIFYANVMDRSRAGSDSFFSPNTVPNHLDDLGNDHSRQPPQHKHLSTVEGPSQFRFQQVPSYMLDPSSMFHGGQNNYQKQSNTRISTASNMGSGTGDSSTTSAADHQTAAFVHLVGQVKKLYNDVERCRSEVVALQRTVDDWRVQAQQEYACLRGALNEEKYKSQRLEDQLNDLAELHQAELSNLRVEARNLEGRLSYQVNSRVEDAQDECGKLSNEISGLKERIKDIKQFVGMEGFEGVTMNAKLKRGLLLLFQFMADFLLVVISLLNRRHVKASLMILILALIVYNAGGYLVWNFVSFLFRLIFYKKPLYNKQQANDDSASGSSGSSTVTPSSRTL